MLTPDEKKMLEVVLEVAGDDEKMIGRGVIQALYGDKASHGEAGRTRRQHLWCVLPNAAKAKIRAAKKKVFQHRLVGV